MLGGAGEVRSGRAGPGRVGLLTDDRVRRDEADHAEVDDACVGIGNRFMNEPGGKRGSCVLPNIMKLGVC